MNKSGNVKIAKYLAECGIGSRRGCETLVTRGKVRVNGRVMKNVAERIDPETDIVEYAGKEVVVARKVVFALYKPRGYVSTLSDPRAGPTLAGLIHPKYASLGLKPVGRLDKDSEGLMLLTNNGALANRIMHPRYGVTKTYQVTLDSAPPERVLGVLRRGVHLPDGDILKPMGTRIIGHGPEAAREVELTLREGKKREIRRAFAMFGYKVKTLRRIAIGPIKLGSIRKGTMVELSKSQMKRLTEAAKK